MPTHKLGLKENVPVMLSRKFDSPMLCNGTRMIVKKLPYVLGVRDGTNLLVLTPNRRIKNVVYKVAMQ